MVRVTVLGSGSKGNCTVVSTSRTCILLDAGFSSREIVKRMRLSGEDPEKLDGILVSHEHSDHVQGLSVLARRWKVPVYATQATHAAWREWMTPRTTMGFQAWLEMRRQQNAEGSRASVDGECGPTEGETILDKVTAEQETGNAADGSAATLEELAERLKCASAPCGDPPEVQELFSRSREADPACLPCVEYFHAGIPFEVGDIRVTPFTIPHDAADPVGFVLQTEGMRIVIATDLGYLAPNVRMQMHGADLLMIESNHDVEMLRDGPYPWVVKQRVLSRVGHLSNDALGEFLASEYDGGARYVILAHISESNNLPELALSSAERALSGKRNLLANKVLLASQRSPLESIQL